jgi:tellurite resistance protein TerC
VPSLFPFADYWWFYAGFAMFVFIMLALDLGVFHRKPREVGFREAAIWSLVWVLLALAFNLGLYTFAREAFASDPRLLALDGFRADAAARQVALEFLTGYVVEKSLSVDNLFIFVMIFSYFRVPAIHQHRVLFYGILGALVFRAIFIALGSALMKIEWVVLVFGVLLVLTGLKMMFAPEKGLDPDRNPLIRILKRFMPLSTAPVNGRFFVVEDGCRKMTTLLVALVFLEFTDILFAIDSVPAIFALTAEPLIVFTSNIFAIFGLRSMYFLLAGMVGRFHFLKYGLAVVLVFVGLKMAWLNHAFGGKFPITWSLGFIATAVGLSIVMSRLFPRPADAAGHESTRPAG